MPQHTQRGVANQVQSARRRLSQDPDLCLGGLLPTKQVQEAIERHGVQFRERLYTPLVTLWAFLYQVLSADQCCRAAVARLLAHLGTDPGPMASARTDPYCKARQRLPEVLVADLARGKGAELDRQVPPAGLLQGRTIKIADGTTLSMPDTAANQKAYPQPPTQKPGLGFPILRLVGLMGLASGAVLEAAMGPYSGKQTGEPALMRQMLKSLSAGEVLLVDACFANYWMIALLLARGVDVVVHHDGKRRVDLRTGRRLGRQDHLIAWDKPPKPPPWMSRGQYRRLPVRLVLRELRVRVEQRGFRVRQFVLVTTLTDAARYPASDLAAAYRARWNAELNLRSIKQVMQMDVLRCKGPDMVRKEVWMHLLAYNLVRTLMARAAASVDATPREISFKGTLQTLLAFAATGVGTADQEALYTAILSAVATHRVGDRPDRIEPRAVKRRPKKQTYLTQPRAVARARLMPRP